MSDSSKEISSLETLRRLTDELKNCKTICEAKSREMEEMKEELVSLYRKIQLLEELINQLNKHISVAYEKLPESSQVTDTNERPNFRTRILTEEHFSDDDVAGIHCGHSRNPRLNPTQFKAGQLTANAKNLKSNSTQVIVGSNSQQKHSLKASKGHENSVVNNVFTAIPSDNGSIVSNYDFRVINPGVNGVQANEADHYPIQVSRPGLMLETQHKLVYRLNEAALQRITSITGTLHPVPISINDDIIVELVEMEVWCYDI